jgi:hypothetical protein
MNACPDLLAALRQRQRDLEMDATAVKSRLAEVQDLIDMIEQPQRRRRSRKPEAPSEPPIHVDGASDTTDTEELPL